MRLLKPKVRVWRWQKSWDDFSAEDARDAEVAKERLSRSGANPNYLISGDELQAELEKLFAYYECRPLFGFAYSAQALANLKTNSPKFRKQIVERIQALATEPHPPNCKVVKNKMEGEEKVFRIRSGDYRVLYSVRNNPLRSWVSTSTIGRMSIDEGQGNIQAKREGPLSIPMTFDEAIKAR